MTAWVLDTSALLAYFWNEPGNERVADVLESGDHVISAVNLSELVSKFVDHGIPDEEIPRLIAGLELSVHAHDAALARDTGTLRRKTRHLGLSLGDRACLALAQQLDAVAITTDRPWLGLDPALGIQVECIRPDI
jgi:PIN domain nuclease of toxin-antitoxin system